MDLLDLLDRPISFHRCFVSVAGSINGALMLSQAVYWSKRTKSEDGSFYKTRDEWEEETGLTHEQQETARKKLRKMGFWHERNERLAHRMHYRIDSAALKAALVAIPASGNRQTPRSHAANSPAPTPCFPVPSNRTETTTETTTERDASLKLMRDEVKKQWNLLPNLPKVLHLSVGRVQTLNQRLKDPWWNENWKEAMKLVPSSPFLMGKVEGRNGGNPFKATLDFFIRPDTVAKILEGTYHGKSEPLPSTGTKKVYTAADHMRAMGIEDA